MSPRKSNNEVSNWYEKIPKGLLPKYHNPCYDVHKIHIPARVLIIGASGSGKTNLAIDFIHKCQDTFTHITLCTKNSDEPLYCLLKSKLKPEELTVKEGYNNIPPLDFYEKIDKEGQHLVIIDDLVIEPKQDKISELFIRGRKVAGGITVLYLSQSYYQIPKIIRLQASYIFLKKISSTRDISMLMKDCSLGLDKDTLLSMYEACTQERTDFMMIDMNAPPEERFRHNYKTII